MNIQDFYKYSWFSTLAYVNWRKRSGLTVQESVEDANAASRIPGEAVGIVDTLGEKIFSPTTDGGEGWQVSDFHSNDAAGFSASLFAKDGTNEKVLAIRGTEPDLATGQLTTDLLLADLHEIGEYGMAISQAVSLFNYVQQLRAPTNTEVAQLNLHIATAPPANGVQFVQTQVTQTQINPPLFTVTDLYFWVDQGAAKPGLELISPTDNLVVTGHSLGGHLAAAAYRMFPQLFDAAVTYNAPGFDPAVGAGGWASDLVSPGQKLTDEFFSKLFAPNLPADEPPASNFGNLANLYSMVSEDEIPGNDKSIVSSFITGTPASLQQAITTERDSHMIEPIMDALAVQALVEKLNPNIGLVGAGALFSAASNNAGKSEEGLLEALSKLFFNDSSQLPIKDIADGLDVWINPGDFTQRTSLHDRAIKIENKIDELRQSGVNLSLVSLTDLSTATLSNFLNTAKQNDATGLAYRYALKELNPFAVVGADYSTTRNPANADLVLYDPTGTGLTDAWLADRAAMLAWNLKLNTEDFVSSVATPYHDAPDQYFQDMGTGQQKIVLGTPMLGQFSRRDFIFGSDNGDTINGGVLSDRLYGMGGDDVINGGAGVDYLEGGTGNDVLNGGSEDDTLLGGIGNDVLDGGTGNNILNGGLGTDVYFVHSGTGNRNQIIETRETNGIADPNGKIQGAIIVDGHYQSGGLDPTIARGLFVRNGSDTSWTYKGSASVALTIGHHSPWKITAPDGSIVDLGDFQDGDYGIRLADNQVPIATNYDRTIIGDRTPIEFYEPDGETAGPIYANGELVDAPYLRTEPAIYSAITGELISPSIDIYAGHIGYRKDDLGNYITDPNQPSPGRTDLLYGSIGNDLIQGLGGHDTLYGGADDDELVGDAKGIAIQYQGSDLLDGGDGNDKLWGYGKDDTLIGGVANDLFWKRSA